MQIGIGIVAFLVFIVFVIVWYLVLKRSIAEAMLLGLLVCCAFSGIQNIPTTFVTSLKDAMTEDVMAAIMLFTIMSSIMTQTGIITRLVNILNAILGRLRGGPAYVSACASALFGMVSGASSANAATVIEHDDERADDGADGHDELQKAGLEHLRDLVQVVGHPA